MPVVDAYGPLKVKEDALPGVRKSNSAATFESAGGTIAQGQEQLARAQGGVGDALANLGGVATRAGLQGLSAIQQQRAIAQQKADQVAVMSADRQLAELEHSLVNDPTSGALSVKGKDTLPLRDSVLQQYDEKAGTIGSSTLTNDRQRLAFERMRDQRRESIGSTLDRYTMQQMAQYDADETKGYVDMAHANAIANAGDPVRVALELKRGAAAITDYGKRNGTAPDQVAAQLADFRSGVHLGVIDRMLTNDQDKAAQIYFDETKDQISGDKLAAVEKALEEGGLRKRGQEQADAILAAGGTLTEQRAKVRAIEDPKLRDAVQERVEHEAAVQEKVDRDRDEATLKGAYDIVDKTASVTSIPPAVWTSLSGGARAALRNYADNLVQGTPIKTDQPTWYGMLDLANTAPEKFINTNLLTLKARLSDSDFQELARLQANIRAGKDKEAAEALDGFRSNQQIVEDTLRGAGLDTSSSKDNADAGRVTQFRRMVDDRAQALGRLTGKKVTPQDVQQISDDLMTQVTTDKPAWWNPFGSPTVKRKFELTVSDIPATDRSLIEAALRAHKHQVTDAAILQLYLAHQETLKK